MRWPGIAALVAIAVLWLAIAAPARRAGPTVLLISIDGMRPEYVLDSATFGGRLPNLRRMLVEGSYATGVRGVMPTVTYPSHTTLITGVSPATHGIVANTTFDPDFKNQGGWYWYASDIRVPTLWDAAAAAGLKTANVHWPVSVGANVSYNLPQYWRAGTADDRKLFRGLASPGLIDGLERELGPYADGIDESIEGDENRARFAERLLERERPNFMTAYFTALDHEQHRGGPAGPDNPEAMRVLERIDGIVGRLRDAARRIGGESAVIAVVSDHGFAPVAREVDLVPALARAGLLDVDSAAHVTGWRVSIWPAGGSVALVVRDSADAASRRRVRDLASMLARDTANGFARVFGADELRQAGAFSGAEVAIALRPPFTSGVATTGAVVRQASVKGMHGYWPDDPRMRSTFLIAGGRVPRGRSLGAIDMRSIAPTLAAILGVELGAEVAAIPAIAAR